MSKSVKITLIVIFGIIGLVALLAVALLLFVDTDAYRTRLEAAASEVLGLEVRVGGRLDFSLFPRVQIALEEVQLASQGAEVGNVKEVRIGIGLLSLLEKQIDIRTLTLIQPKIFLERNADGNINFGPPQSVGGTSHELDVSLTEGTFQFQNRQSGDRWEVLGCNLMAAPLRLAGRGSAGFLKTLSFTADLDCEELRLNDFTASDVRVSATGDNGVIDLDPITMQVLGGRGSGSMHADFSGTVPRFEVRYALPQFRIEDFFKSLSPQKFAEGPMDFTATLSLQGKTRGEIVRSAAGQISLHGEHLQIHGRDLDQEFARFESSQNFNLVDVGAFFIAGPFGLLVTKGYNFASILQGAGGNSEIRTLHSDWLVDHGTAKARDVALATREHRVAMQGEIDFGNEMFNDVTVALIDAEGCAKVRQSIGGKFQNPVVEQPSIFMSLSGPIRKLMKMGRDLFPGGECEPFYDGSVAPPN